MKSTRGLSKFINEDIDIAKKSLYTKLQKDLEKIKNPSEKIQELAKEYIRMSERSEKISQEIRRLGYNVSTCGHDKGQVSFITPSFYSWDKKATIDDVNITGSYAEEVKDIIKEAKNKSNKLEGLKRAYAIKLLGGGEATKILAELAKELASIIS